MTPTLKEVPSLGNPCICGRDYVHCYNCGAKNPRVHQAESGRRSQQVGIFLNVRKCATCMCFTDETWECRATPRVKAVERPPAEKKRHEAAIDNRPQFTLDPSSDEYKMAFATRYNELAGNVKLRGTLSTMDAMLKEGWQNIMQSEAETEVQPDAEPQVSPSELSLEQIIERMKKEQE